MHWKGPKWPKMAVFIIFTPEWTKNVFFFKKILFWKTFGHLQLLNSSATLMVCNIIISIILLVFKEISNVRYPKIGYFGLFWQFLGTLTFLSRQKHWWSMWFICPNKFLAFQGNFLHLMAQNTPKLAILDCFRPFWGT